MSVTINITVNTAYPAPVALSRPAPSLRGGAVVVMVFLTLAGLAAPALAQGDTAAGSEAHTAAGSEAHTAADTAAVPQPDTAGPQDDTTSAWTDHPFDVWDALGLPLRIVTAPLAALGIAVREGLRLVAPGSGSPGSPAGSGPLGSRLLAGTVGPRSGPALGLRVEEPTPAWAEVMGSIRGSWRATGGVTVPLKSERSNDSDERASATGTPGAELQLVVERHAEPHFWGVGPDSPPEGRADFEWRRWEARGGLRWPAAAGFRLSAGLEGSRTGPGADASVPDLVDLLEPDALPGLGRTLRHVRVGVGFRPGRTRWTGLRSRGIRARLEADLHLGLSGAPHFTVFRAGLAGDVPAGPQRGLALFLRGAVAEPFGGDELPFTHLPALGGDIGGRGFDGDRYRDRALLAGGGEWRWELWRTIHGDTAVEAFLFLESGTVAPRAEALSTGKLRTSWGGGLRLVTLEGLRAFGGVGVGERVRLDAGVSWPF